MANVIRVAIVDPVDFSRNELKTMLLGLDVVWLVADCHRYEFFPDVIAQAQPDLALVVLDSNPTKGLELIGRIHADAPDCTVLVVSSSTEGSLILQAMRNGAKEFLAAPLKIDDFLSALDRLRHLTVKNSVDGQVRTSQVIALAGASGGVGCTSLAINLACCLAQRGQQRVDHRSRPVSRRHRRLARHHSRLHDSGRCRQHHPPRLLAAEAVADET